MKVHNKIFWPVVMTLVVSLAFTSCEKNSPADVDDDTDAGVETDIEYWLTTGNKSSLLQKLDHPLKWGSTNTASPAIVVDTTQRFQAIDGFGFSLTGGSAFLIHEKLTSGKRTELLTELFSPEGAGIGVSYLRISIGASDLDDHVFSYNDLPQGQTDVNMEKFTLEEDRKHLIPVLKEILAINPSIKIMGSPWSAPPWMKTNNSTKGGSLKPEYYGAYAKYFVKYIQGMKSEGITIDAITIQNEPENPNNNPSLVMTAVEQATFIKDHLGPAFESANIKTKIVLFDHNCDHPNYPITILNDPAAKKYVDGSAFHLYLGEIEALSEVHQAHPDKNLYFTEQWTSSEGKFNEDLRWHVKHLVVGATRNWARNVLEWNLASDPQFHPHTDGGCTMCKGALTIGTDVERNVSYYIIAHASKFVRPESVRVGSTVVAGLPNVSFITPAGKKVLIVVNDSEVVRNFNIGFKEKLAEVSLAGGAVGTFVW